MRSQIAKALDLDPTSVSQNEIVELIRRNKLMAEQAARNKGVIENLQMTLHQHGRKRTGQSRTKSSEKNLEALQREAATHSMLGEQQPEY